MFDALKEKLENVRLQRKYTTRRAQTRGIIRKSCRSSREARANASVADYVYIDGEYQEKIVSPWRKPRLSRNPSSFTS